MRMLSQLYRCRRSSSSSLMTIRNHYVSSSVTKLSVVPRFQQRQSLKYYIQSSSSSSSSSSSRIPFPSSISKTKHCFFSSTTLKVNEDQQQLQKNNQNDDKERTNIFLDTIMERYPPDDRSTSTKGWLHEVYHLVSSPAPTYRVFSTNNTLKSQQPQQLRWIAILDCPITNWSFPCTTIPNHDDCITEYLQSTNNNKNNNNSSSQEDLPIFTYRSKKEAEQAAAYAACQHFISNQKGSMPSQDILHNINHWIESKQLLTPSSQQQQQQQQRQKVIELTMPNYESHQSHPKDFLLRYYTMLKNNDKTNEDYNVPFSKETIQSWCEVQSISAQIETITNIDNDDDDGKLSTVQLHTAYWKCPHTKEVFSSGTLPEYQDDAATILNDDKQDIYYTKSKYAEQAAAARALDCLSYRHFQNSQSSTNPTKPIRICVEEPYLAPTSTSTTQTLDEKEEEEEEYIIQYIPGVTSSNTQEKNNNVITTTTPTTSGSTMERVLEAWATTTKENKTNENEDITSILQPKNNTIANALAWYQRMISSKNNNNISSNLSVVSCNAILTALAHCNQQQQQSPYNYDHNEKNIETLATQILEQMSQHSSNQQKDDYISPWTCQPNIDSYNAYIQCLQRSTPYDTAIAGEHIFATKILQNYKPTTSTYNAIISLWSKVPTLEAYYHVKQFYQEQIISTQGKTNEETFLLCLNSLLNLQYLDDIDPDFIYSEAKNHWIPEFQKRSNVDDEDIPIHIYNAVLPWSGESKTSNVMRLPQSWDDYGALFSNASFHPPNDQSATSLKAKAMEEWVHEYIPNPNIETYESMIQVSRIISLLSKSF